MTRSLRRALVCACLLALLPLPSVLGHSELSSASPGPDEVVAGSPPELVARFTQDLRVDRTSIELRDPAGQTVVRGGKDPDRARVQRVALPSLAPGVYEVRWVSFSAEDDELARGRYTFTVVEASPAPSLAPSPIPTACPSLLPSVSPGASSVPVPTASLVVGAGASPSMEPSPTPVPPAPCPSPLPSPTVAPPESPAASVVP